MVKVDLGALDGRESAQVFVVRVVLQEGDALRPDTLQDLLRDGRLAGSRSACDADDEWCGMRHAVIIPAEKAEPRFLGESWVLQKVAYIPAI
ncbi:MAG: hypothetical protein A3K41_16925 [Chloroflexi bacterium RIFOXYD12_FULL_57_15]|nr:MAG: hypothetical protein A3K41_16925 [Chloroflexi bacterium RIFOXYD12_FULL_57_15]